MEVYEMPITLEEARNYHKVIYQLKMLSPVEWIKTYIYTVIFSLIFSFILFILTTSLSGSLNDFIKNYILNTIEHRTIMIDYSSVQNINIENKINNLLKNDSSIVEFYEYEPPIAVDIKNSKLFRWKRFFRKNYDYRI